MVINDDESKQVNTVQQLVANEMKFEADQEIEQAGESAQVAFNKIT